MNTSTRITLAVCITGAMLIIGLITLAVRHGNAREAACTNKGGVEIISHNGNSFCIKRDVFIPF